MTSPEPSSWGTKARVGVASAVGLQLVLILGIVVAVNWISSRRYRRFDLTDDVTYSLGPKTRQLLAKISEGEAKYQIVVFYLPDEGGAWEAALKRTEDLLQEYQTQSRDRISFEIVQVATVGGGGVQSAQKKHDIRSQIGPNDVVFKKGETERVVNLREFFGQEWEDVGPHSAPKLTSFNGEAIVTSTLQVLSQERPIVIGFTTGHDEASPDDVQQPEEWGVFAHGLLETREGYKIRTVTLPPGAGVPKDVDVLVLAGPKKDFNDGEVTTLKLYLNQGGRILVTLDSGPECGDRPLPNIFAFLAVFGITPQVDIVLDPPMAIDVEYREGEGIKRTKDKATFQVASFDRKHPVTAKFDTDKQVFMKGACSLLVNGENVEEGLKTIELAHCSSDGWGEKDYLKEGAQVMFNPNRDEPGPLSLAAAVSGRMKGSTGDEMRLVVLGDSSSVANGLQRMFPPPDFMVNSIRWLAKQEYLISVDPKRPEDRSLNLTLESDKYVFRVCVLFLPVLAMAFGLTMFLTRRAQ